MSTLRQYITRAPFSPHSSGRRRKDIQLRSKMVGFNRQLFYLKIFILCHFGAVFSFWPFFTLQGISAGVSMEQLAIVNLVAPMCSIIGPLISGYVADRIGNYKLFFTAFFISLSATTWGFLLLDIKTNSSVTDIMASSSDSNSTRENSTQLEASYQSGEFSQFGAFFALCLLLTLFTDGCYSLCDSITIMVSNEHNAELGQQRLFASLSFAIFPILSGFIMDYGRLFDMTGFGGYSTTTYLSTVMTLVSLLTLSRLHVRCAPREKETSTGLWNLLKQTDVTFFLLAYIVTGVLFGFNTAFEFAYLRSLNAPSYLQGLPGCLGSLIAIGVLGFSGTLLRKLGPQRILMISLMAWCIKFLGYSFLTNPWFALVLALLDAMTTPLSGFSAGCFCSQNAPPGLLASLAGAFSASFFGIGKGIGGSIGGKLIHKYGFRVPYRAFNIVAGVASLIYCVAYHFNLKSLEEKRLQKVAHEKETGHDNPAYKPDETTEKTVEEDSRDRQHGGSKITHL